jgi:hypothetical protein
MLETRHVMSQAVRTESQPRAAEWGYQLGSVYIRKVHFRDLAMIRQIEEKVVNRLRQVTSAIRQDGNNQVNIIKSTADRHGGHRVRSRRRAATAHRRQGPAAASPPTLEVMESMFETLETQKLLESNAPVTLLPERSNASGLLTPLLAARTAVPIK